MVNVTSEVSMERKFVLHFLSNFLDIRCDIGNFYNLLFVVILGTFKIC